jgi:transmembrane 9 superfamily protein 3
MLFFSSGKTWIKSMILTASLFPFMCFGIGFVLNTIAIFYGSLAAIPFGTMVVVFVIWAFISFPLALLGTVVGRNWSGAPNNPCRVKTIPRPIPEKKWYLTPSVVSMMGGLLPFGSIFIEMYFVFTSFWNYKVNFHNCVCLWLMEYIKYMIKYKYIGQSKIKLQKLGVIMTLHN